MIETIKRVVADMLNMQARTQFGTITAYNQNNYTVKVMIQPNGPPTGWIPLAAAWAGNNMGAVFGPEVGTDCRIDFIDGHPEVAVAGSRFFNAKNAPPIVQSGQGAIVDAAGSYVRLNNDGTITLGASAGITSTTPLLKQVGNFEVDGTMKVTQTTELDGNVTMKAAASVAQVATVGALASNGTAGASSVTGSINITGGDVTADGKSLKTHVHSDPQGGTTGTPI